MTEFLLPLTNLLIAVVALLDSMPAYIRALLAGLILAAILSYFERRVCEDEIQFCQSFRKACLSALLIVPLIVAVMPGSRMAVFVENLPVRNTEFTWLWMGLGVIWLAGCSAALIALLRAYLMLAATLRDSEALGEREKILTRLPHWCSRLGLKKPYTLRLLSSSLPRSLPFTRGIGYPAHALHWPDSVQDILLIRELCHHKRHNSAWHLLASIVACCYWPVTWLPRMHSRLLASLQITTDSLAESCYGDRMSYGRGLRQLEARMSAPAAPARSATGDSLTMSRLARVRATLSHYRSDLGRLMSPNTDLRLDFSDLFERRDNREHHINAEPYDKVFWFIGQAVIVAMLITGPTLKQLPADVEEQYFLPFEFVWMENFHRNQERVERNQPPLEPVVPAEQ